MKRFCDSLASACLVMSFVVLAASASAQQVSQTDYSAVGLTPASGGVRGITQCKSDLALAFAVSGLVAETYVEEGQQVQAGDVLLRLEQSIEDIEMRRRELVWKSTSEAEAAAARLQVAQAQWEAAQRIYESSNGISREELQNRRLAFEIARSEIDRLTTQKEMEHLDFLTAQETLKQRTLRAPTLGIVSELIRKTGESAQANDPVLQLCDLSQINFVANVPVALGEILNLSERVELSFSGHSEQVEGRIVFVSPVVDSASGLRTLKVEIPNSPDWLRPGLNADLSVKTR